MYRTFDYQRLFKWLFLFFLLLMIIAIVYSVLLYRDLEKSKTRGMSQTEQRIYKETDITKVEDIDFFYSNESYHVVYGTDKEKHKLIAFVPLKSKKQDIKTINQDEIISKETVHKQWKKSCTECKMIKITPGIVDENKVWELTYRDELNRYVLEFLSISDGKQYERLRFAERFK